MSEQSEENSWFFQFLKYCQRTTLDCTEGQEQLLLQNSTSRDENIRSAVQFQVRPRTIAYHFVYASWDITFSWQAEKWSESFQR